MIHTKGLQLLWIINRNFASYDVSSPQHLLTPAELIYQATNDTKIPAILFGEDAGKLNGFDRETKVILFPRPRMSSC